MSLTVPLLTYSSSTDLILKAVAQAIKKGANDVEIIISYQYSGFTRILLTGKTVTEKDDIVIIRRERIPYKLSVNFGSMSRVCCNGRNKRLLDRFGRNLLDFGRKDCFKSETYSFFTSFSCFGEMFQLLDVP